LGEGAAVGVAELGGDDAGWFLAGRHRQGQGVAQQVGWAASPTLTARRQGGGRDRGAAADRPEGGRGGNPSRTQREIPQGVLGAPRAAGAVRSISTILKPRRRAWRPGARSMSCGLPFAAAGAPYRPRPSRMERRSSLRTWDGEQRPSAAHPDLPRAGTIALVSPANFDEGGPMARFQVGFASTEPEGLFAADPDAYPRALQSSWIPGATANRYGRTWFLSRQRNLVDSIWTGRIGFVQEDELMTVFWDPNEADFARQAAPSGVVVPFAINANSGFVAFQLIQASFVRRPSQAPSRLF
jgi:hypothetical protein